MLINLIYVIGCISQLEQSVVRYTRQRWDRWEGIRGLRKKTSEMTENIVRDKEAKARTKWFTDEGLSVAKDLELWAEYFLCRRRLLVELLSRQKAHSTPCPCKTRHFRHLFIHRAHQSISSSWPACDCQLVTHASLIIKLMLSCICTNNLHAFKHVWLFSFSFSHTVVLDSLHRN